MSLLLSFLSIFAILAYSFHLTLFALRTFSGASPSAIFPDLWVLASPYGYVLGLLVHGDG